MIDNKDFYPAIIIAIAGFFIRSKKATDVLIVLLRKLLLGENIGEKMLEGKEVEGKIADVGSYYLDADATGAVKIGVDLSKDLDIAKFKNKTEVEVHIMAILEKVVSQTEATWDDELIAKIKLLLGLK